ncbi:helicase [Companilactobacillus sp. RD055328]|nr:helicase [Companilactobacillus sp. RD055328]
MKIPELYEDYFAKRNFKNLTAIQDLTYESFLNKKDLLAMAPTGSGKTLAFSLPLVENIESRMGLQVIILEPSQELAVQVRDVLQPLLKLKDAKVMALTGGANTKRQVDKLKKEKPEVIVATIGRLNEMVDIGRVKLIKANTLVIDEADELLSNEKLESIRAITSRMKDDVHIAMFSATASPIFDELHKWFGRDFEVIDDRENQEYRRGIKHYFINATNNRNELIRKLAHDKKFQGIVFFNSSRQLHKTASDLNYKKTNYVMLDSKSSSQQRKDALTKFTTKKVNLLLTSDVAARGIDIPQTNTIINYMIPRSSEEYIHRSGRTGRMGRNGASITFGNDHDYRNFKNILAKDFDVKNVVINGEGEFVKSNKITRAAIAKKDEPKKKKRLRDQKNKGKRKTK